MSGDDARCPVFPAAVDVSKVLGLVLPEDPLTSNVPITKSLGAIFRIERTLGQRDLRR
jgi:hypothetical protein